MLPKDVEAYLIGAAVRMAEEQGLGTATERAMMEWISNNHVAICERARQDMHNLLMKFHHNAEVRRTIVDEICKNVWETINQAK